MSNGPDVGISESSTVIHVAVGRPGISSAQAALGRRAGGGTSTARSPQIPIRARARRRIRVSTHPYVGPSGCCQRRRRALRPTHQRGEQDLARNRPHRTRVPALPGKGAGSGRMGERRAGLGGAQGRLSARLGTPPGRCPRLCQRRRAGTDPAGPQRKPPAGSPLTRREQQVAELIADGLSNKQMAAPLVISQRTAESHAEKILRKVGLTSRTQVAIWVAQRHQRRAAAASGPDRAVHHRQRAVTAGVVAGPPRPDAWWRRSLTAIVADTDASTRLTPDSAQSTPVLRRPRNIPVGPTPTLATYRRT